MPIVQAAHIAGLRSSVDGLAPCLSDFDVASTCRSVLIIEEAVCSIEGLVWSLRSFPARNDGNQVFQG